MMAEDLSPFALDPAQADEDRLFLENPEPRCPCVLLLDTSYSMRGRPIAELNTAVRAFKDELAADELAAKRVEVAVVGFGPVAVKQDFVGADGFAPPTLEATGDTPMGAAIVTAVDLVRERQRSYRNHGVQSYKPWIFLITDGAPTDSWLDAARQVKEGEERQEFLFFAVGVEGARIDVLSQISARPAVKLDGLRFRDLFIWLSKSLQQVSRSQAGDRISLPPMDWGNVQV